MANNEKSVGTRVWRDNFEERVRQPEGSRYTAMSVEGFHERTDNAVYDRRIQCVDRFGDAYTLHVFVGAHAGRNVRFRGNSTCHELYIDWLKEALRYPDILDSVLVAEDCQKFFVLDREWGRIITFTVLACQSEYEVLMQSVFFLSQNNHEAFFIKSETSLCFSIGAGNQLLSGVENIPEMTY